MELAALLKLIFTVSAAAPEIAALIQSAADGNEPDAATIEAHAARYAALKSERDQIIAAAEQRIAVGD